MLVSARSLTDEHPRGTQGFPRERRLTRGAQYQQVFAGAHKAGGAYFTVLGRPNTCGHPRLGLAVSRRAAPRAVDRNRLKRVIREAFRHNQHSLGGIDIVVLAKAPARGADNAALTAAVLKQWQRLSQRCASS